MSAPFFDNIGGTVSTGPTTGSFTPTAAASMCRSWTNIPAGRFVYYRAEEGTNWENGFGWWNGTTLARTVMYSSNSDALVSFGTGVVIYAVGDSDEVQPNLGSANLFEIFGLWNANAVSYVPTGIVPTTYGTSANTVLANSTVLGSQQKIQYTALSGANLLAGVLATGTAAGVIPSSTAGAGGFEFISRVGFSTLIAAPRLMVGMAAGSGMTTAEPSTIADQAAFTLDSTDTNIQFRTRNASATTAINTGIPLVVNGLYEMAIWSASGDPTNVYGRLKRLDTGAAWFGKISTTTPTVGAYLGWITQVGQNSSNGASTIVMQFCKMSLRVSS